MRDFIGVRTLLGLRYSNSLKRDAILFNRIAIPQLTNTLRVINPSEYIVSELDLLLSKGIVFDTDLQNDELFENEEFRRYAVLLMRIPVPAPGVEVPHFKEKVFLASDCYARMISMDLRKSHLLDAIPILDAEIPPTHDKPATRNNIVEIVIDALPVPDDGVSWEQVLDYRSDPDTTHKFLALRNWMNEVTRTELSPAEIEEKLEYLISNYEQHMKLHRLRIHTGKLETILIAGAGLVENLAKFNLEKAAKGLFSFRYKRIALMESELTVPGSEVAYIIKARKTFT